MNKKLNKDDFIKVRITTIRTLFDEEDFNDWIKQLNENGIPVDRDELYFTGKWQIDNKSSDFDVSTIYELID